MPTTSTMFVMLGPCTPMTVMARRMKGNAHWRSASRMMASSQAPPRIPASNPSEAPVSPATSMADSPIRTEVRAPKTSRLRTSRPSWSVPSTARVPSAARLAGGTKRAVRRCSLGSAGATRPGARAPRKTTRRVPAPNRALREATKTRVRRQPAAPGPSGRPADVDTVRAARRTPSLGKAYAGIEAHVGEVDHEVQRAQHAGHGKDDGLDERDVLVHDRLHSQPADAGVGEDRLGHHRAPEEIAELQPEGGDDRNRPVAEGVAKDDGALADALGARGAQDVLGEPLEEAGPRDPGGAGGGPHAERDRGKDQGEEALAAVDGDPAQVDPEDQDEEDAQPERGHALPGEGEHHGGGVDQRVPPEGGQDAERDGDEGGQRHRGADQLERRREAREHERERRLAVSQGPAEVPVEGAQGEPAVLLRERTIEPQGGPDQLVIRLRPLRSHVEGRRVARQVDDQEHAERDADEDERGPAEPPAEVADHDRGSSVTSARERR